MKISIFGMGYVGAVSSACFTNDGHNVVGVDIDQVKVDLINSGNSPIIEKDLNEYINRAITSKKLTATKNIKEAIIQTDISIICVGTPSQINGNLDLSYIRKVCEEIAKEIKNKDQYHIVVMRSTVLPGTAHNLAIPILEKFSGKKVGVDFGYASNPEFLREGSAIYDFYNPPKTVIGHSDEKTAQTIACLYDKLAAPLIMTDIKTAEMVKYADNAWHAVKVTFGNEIGNIAKDLGIDGQKVMEIFCQDEKLNLSPYYLRPGFAFGGSCLPKDVRAITYRANSLDIKTPLLSSLLPSNEEQVKRAFSMIQKTGKRNIGLLGLSFKAGTDDLRESPLVELAEMLIGKGYNLKIYDKNIKMATLIGANKNYLLNSIPHITTLLTDDLNTLKESSDVLIIGNASDEFLDVQKSATKDQTIIDLIRISKKTSDENYQGICW
ncbi:MAG: GDP-mannose dehydrogenase [Epsilonproteobacteria bacterium]|nr:MAG: GDP-mannose dehydrogenase [Campylobacterota bacterium]